MAPQQEANLTTLDVIGTERVKREVNAWNNTRKNVSGLCSIFGMVNTKMD